MVDAAEEGARTRYRPVMMTALAFIIGVVPLVFATGAGAGGRESIGTTVFGGMILACLSACFSCRCCSSGSSCSPAPPSGSSVEAAVTARHE